MNRAARLALGCLLLLSAPLHAETKDPISEFPNRVKKFTLKNGMRVLVMERPNSQTISFAMYIRTGGLDDETGKTGLAHMFEHMLFKGTKTIGTKDYAKEAPLLGELDKANADLQREMDKGEKADQKQLMLLEGKVQELNRKHEEILEDEEYWRIYERAGGRDMNASTGYDFTDYTVSLPANYLKLWMTMEAERIKFPVLREFYKERSVVLEERRMRIDTNPQGKLWETFLATAFMAHPYGRPIVGWESDISRVTRQDADDFFKAHYDISRLVVGIVGGVKADEVEKLCRQYFEPIPSSPSHRDTHITEEPRQEGERRAQVEFDAEPSILIGYHRPDMLHPDNSALAVAEDLLSSGRTSRFNREIVEKNKIGVSAWAASSAPGERDANLFMMGGTPRSPRTVQDLEKALTDQVEKLANEGPTARELEKVRNNLEASIIRQLSSNDGMASQLAYHEAIAGDWTYLISEIENIRKVTAADVKRVLKTYCIPSNKTVAYIVRKKK